MTPHLPSMSDQEMNVACAEELGWKSYYRLSPLLGREVLVLLDVNGNKRGGPPLFTTSADACLLLIRYLNEKGWAVELWSDKKGPWYAGLWDEEAHIKTAEADTMPMAITRLALLATGRAQN